jgi:N-acetylmuramoyl-L-alanine amidase
MKTDLMHTKPNQVVYNVIIMETQSEPTLPENDSDPGTLPKPQTSHVLRNALIIAIFIATLFVSVTPNSLSGSLSEQLGLLLVSQPNTIILPDGTPRPLIKIGIVSGHWGNDSGAVCEDGTTEAEINLRIATLVQQKLSALGFETDLLKEFDTRLSGYHAAVLVSIHNDSCEYINDQATGFKVAAAMSSRDLKLANRLAGCLRDRYQRTTGLPLHNSVTNDMSLYHAFNEIDPNTTAGIIETGFLRLDYDILKNKTDLVATGVSKGIICFINNENIGPTPAP